MTESTHQSPVVTIVCVTYNHAKFIRNAIEGFLMQKTSFPIEIIIHDDASIDENQKIIKEYAAQHPNIRAILQKENQYSKGKRLTYPLILQSKGRYIAICEGDDYWTDPLKLQKQVDFLEKNPSFVVCHHDFVSIDSEDNVVDNVYSDNKYDYTPEQMVLGALLKSNTLLFRNVNLHFPPDILKISNFDTYLISQLSKFGTAKYLADIKPSVYRIHDGGIWSKLDQQKKIDAQIKTYTVIKKFSDRKYHRKLNNKLFRLKYKKYAYYRSLKQKRNWLAQTSEMLISHPILFAKTLVERKAKRLKSI